MKRKLTDEQLIALLEDNDQEAINELVAQDDSLSKRIEEIREVLMIMSEAGEVEVPAHIKLNVEKAIINASSKSSQFSLMHLVAAVAFLVVGFALGIWSQGGTSKDELAILREEVFLLKRATLTTSLQRHSASERIMAVNRIEKEASINPELLSTLVATLNSDESPSVRYAALQALGKFINDESVRSELVRSLATQSDPLVQISLISMLVEAEERGAIVPLQDILNQEEITPEVKQQAEVALQVLT